MFPSNLKIVYIKIIKIANKIKLSTDHQIFFYRFHLSQRPLLTPCEDHVHRTRKDIGKSEDEKDNDGMHDDHDHREDDENKNTERFSLRQIKFLETKVSNV
jgi:hypothetical protein